VKYIEIAIGQPNNRNIIIKESELKTYVAKANALGQSLYRSYYTYDENILDHMKIYKTIRSYKGTYWLDKIIIDIDRGKSSDQLVLLRTKDFIARLEDDWKVGRELQKIWYSGTGYHVSFPDIFHFEPSSYLPDEVEATLGHFFYEMDTKPLMRTGLIRVGYSLNTKSNLFKIPLSYDEIQTLSCFDIMELAKKGNPRKIEKWEDEGIIPDHSRRIIKAKVQRTQETERTEPTRILTCSQRIFIEGATEGNRHTNLVALVSVWRLQGIPYEGVMALAKYWNNDSLSQYELEKQVKYIWDRGYSIGCKNETLLKYCSDKCIHWKNKDFTLEVSNSEELEHRFAQYIKSGLSKNSFSLQTFYPKLANPYTISPAEAVFIIGDTKLGKSTLIQNWCINLPKFNILYLALENGEYLTYRRFIQIAHKMTKAQVEEEYQQGSLGLLSKAMSHIHVITSSPDLSSIRKVIGTGKYNLVVVDVIDAITTVAKGETERITEIVNGFKSIANHFNTIMLGIHHISRNAAQDEKGYAKELTIHSAKSASALEQKADKVIGIEGIADTSIRTIRSLGARDESPFITQIYFNKDTFKMEQI